MYSIEIPKNCRFCDKPLTTLKCGYCGVNNTATMIIEDIIEIEVDSEIVRACRGKWNLPVYQTELLRNVKFTTLEGKYELTLREEGK